MEEMLEQFGVWQMDDVQALLVILQNYKMDRAVEPYCSWTDEQWAEIYRPELLRQVDGTPATVAERRVLWRSLMTGLVYNGVTAQCCWFLSFCDKMQCFWLV